MSAKRRARAIGFSRTLGISDAVALGAGISVGIGIIVLGEVIFRTSGDQSPLVFAVAAFLFLPVILSLVERASVTPRAAGFYQLSTLDGSNGQNFAIGWLSIGGYLGLTILLAEEVSRRLIFVIRIFEGTEFPLTPTVGVVVVTAALVAFFGEASWSRKKTLAVLACLAVPMAALAWRMAEAPLIDTAGVEHQPLDHWLTGVALLGAAVAGIEQILAQRHQMRRPNFTSLWGSIILWCFVLIVATVVLIAMLRRPEFLDASYLETLAQRTSRFRLVTDLSGTLICWLGLLRTLTSGARLIGSMARDGLLPAWLKSRRSETGSIVAGLLVTTLAVGLFSFLSNPLNVVGAAAFCFLAINVVLLGRWARQRRSDLPAAQRLHLPLHPLIPGLATVLSAFLMLVLPIRSYPTAITWIVLGGACFLAYARRSGLEVGRHGLVPEDLEQIPSKDSYRLLVGAGRVKSTIARLRVASAIASQKNGDVVLIRVVPPGDTIDSDLTETKALAEMQALEDLLDANEFAAPIRPLVSIAPSLSAGMLSSASEYEADLIVLGWPDTRIDKSYYSLGEISQVFTGTSRSVAILKGGIPDSVDSLAVATAGGPHSTFALEIATLLASLEETSCGLLHVHTREEDASASQEILDATLAAVETTHPVANARIVKAKRVEEGLLEATEKTDLLFIGASVDRLLRQTHMGGLAARLMENRKGASLLVRRAEKVTQFWQRRLWELWTRALPVLSPEDRSEVFTQMRQSARADTDFYALISLSSIIATMGLLLNSSAVIIGAMLVAPLMSPILALAHGIVRGSPRMIRRAGGSTFKGIMIAVGLSAILAMLNPSDTPTAEILARTQPNILDLVVALAAGAAAAYAVSRVSLSAALPGVAISVALVPPLCVVGWGIGVSRFELAGGAMLLFLTNLAGIVLIGALVFMSLGFRPIRDESGENVRRSTIVAAAAILLLTVPLALHTAESLKTEALRQRITLLSREPFVRELGRLGDLRVRKRHGVYEVKLTIHALEDLSGGNRLEELRAHLERRTGVPVLLDATLLPARQVILQSPTLKSPSVRYLVPEPSPQEPPIEEPFTQELPEQGPSTQEAPAPDPPAPDPPAPDPPGQD